MGRALVLEQVLVEVGEEPAGGQHSRRAEEEVPVEAVVEVVEQGWLVGVEQGLLEVGVVGQA